MRCCLLLLFPLLAGALTHYEIEGTYSAIKPENVRAHLKNRAGFRAAEETIRERFASLASGFTEEFFIDFFEIHGEDDRETVIFHGYLTTAYSREEIEHLVDSTEDLHVYVLSKQDSLPLPPSLISSTLAVDSCSNGGVLLPNATCACKRFYSGTSCEIVQCLHEGIQVGARCSCPPGVTTVNCEPRKCQPSVAGDFTRKQSSIILVINQDARAARSLMALIQTLGQPVGSSTYNTFIVVNYLDSSKGFYMQQKQFVFFSDMVNYLNSLSLGTGYDKQPTNKAALAAQSFAPNMYPFSQVVVLTAAPDSETAAPSYVASSHGVEDRLVLKSLAWRNRITYFVQNVKDDFSSFSRVAQATFGDLFYLDVSDLTSNIFGIVLPVLPGSEIVALQNNAPIFMAVPLPITETQYGNVTLFLTVKPGSDFPVLKGSNGDPLIGANFKYAQVFTFSKDDTVSITATSGFVAKALVPSTSTAVLAYSNNLDVDVGDAFMLSGIDNNLAGQYVDIASNASFTLELLDITNGNSLKTFASPKQTSDCSLSLQFGMIKLTTVGSYVQKLTFTDGTTTNTRIIPGFAALIGTVDQPGFHCFNGGVDNGDGTCSCSKNFNGSDCSIPNCGSYSVNQFPGNGQGLCICPQGTAGDFCDEAVCYPDPAEDLGSLSRSLAFVVQASWSQAIYNGAIIEGFKGLYENVKYDEYILTTYNIIRSNGRDVPNVNTTVYTSSDDFLNAVASISYSATFVSSLNVVEALVATVSTINYQKSPIFLFLDSLPSSKDMEGMVMSVATSKFAQIHVTTSQSILDDGTVDLSYFQDYAVATGGLYFDSSTATGFNNVSEAITEFISMYGFIFPGTEIVDEHPPNNCSLGVIETAILKAEQDKLSWFVINAAVSTDFNVTLNGMPADSVSDIPTIGIYQIDRDLIEADPKRQVQAKATVNSAKLDLCSWKIITQSSETATAEFLQMGVPTNFSKALLVGSSYQPTVYSPSDISDTPGTQNVAITIKNAGGKTVYSSKNEVSKNCSKQISFPTVFGCDSANDQYIVTTTITLPNYSLQRTQRAWCYIPYGKCFHGGTWDSTYKECYCTGDPNFTGTYCEVPICQNKGTLLNRYSENTCSCPSGYSGDICQYRVCPSMNFMEAADVRENDYQQMVFVVNTNMDMLLVSVYLKNLVQNLTGETATPSNPRQYTLITFDDANVKLVSSTWDSAKFQAQFTSAMGSFSKEQGVPTKSLDALHQAIASVVQPAATIFLITGTNSSDPSLMSHLLPKQRIGTQINVIYTQAVTSTVPSQPADGRLPTMARLSGGRVLPVTPNSLSTFNKIVDSIVAENALVQDGGEQDCDGSGVSGGFNVAKTDKRITLVVTGSGVSKTLKVTDAFGNATTYRAIFSDTAAVIAQIDLPTNIPPGFWGFTVNTNNGSCFYQVYSISPIRVIPGFSSTDNDDFPSSVPLIGNQRVFFHVHGDPNIQLLGLSYRTMDNLYEPWTIGTGGGLQFYPRDPLTCSYQWMSDPINMANSSYMKFDLTGQITGGTQFQRTFYYQLPPPDVVCQSPYGQLDPNSGLCVCNQNYYGDDCSELRCQNGGTSTFGVCACPDGYYGQFCEKYTPGNGTTTVTPPATVSTIIPQTTVSTMKTTTTVATTPSTAVTTSGPPTTTGTTTLGPCAPKFTTYYFSFFVDSTYPLPYNPSAFYAAQHDTIDQVGQTVDIDTQNQQANGTKFTLSGVQSVFYPGGLVSSLDEIDALFYGGTLDNNDGMSDVNFNLTNAINQFLTTTDYYAVPTGSKPGFAVLFAQSQPLGSKDDFAAAVQKLKQANYQVIGVINSTPLVGSPMDFFQSVLGSVNVYTMDTTTNAAAFINKRACQLKPF